MLEDYYHPSKHIQLMWKKKTCILTTIKEFQHMHYICSEDDFSMYSWWISIVKKATDKKIPWCRNGSFSRVIRSYKRVRQFLYMKNEIDNSVSWATHRTRAFSVVQILFGTVSLPINSLIRSVCKCVLLSIQSQDIA